VVCLTCPPATHRQGRVSLQLGLYRAVGRRLINIHIETANATPMCTASYPEFQVATECRKMLFICKCQVVISSSCSHSIFQRETSPAPTTGITAHAAPPPLTPLRPHRLQSLPHQRAGHAGPVVPSRGVGCASGMPALPLVAPPRLAARLCTVEPQMVGRGDDDLRWFQGRGWKEWRWSG